MEAEKWGTQLTCVNCGCAVHWTAIQCHVCDRNPRVRELKAKGTSCQQNPASKITERRKHPRYDFQGRVILNRAYPGELLDLSQSGARFKTALQLFCDEIVNLDFTVNDVRIQVRARVVHVRRGVLDDRFTLGVFFEAIASDHSEILSHHLHEISGERETAQCFV
jgi:hypothetical protein